MLGLIVVAPLVLLAPGYLVVAILRARDPRMDLVEAGVESLGLAAIVSLSMLVLLGFALTQTVGLTRASLAASLGLIFLVLGWLARREGLGAARLRRQAHQDRASEPPTPASAGGSSLSPSHGAALVGLVVVLVALGGFLYDASEPYSEAYYANASEVEANTTVSPGEEIAWTIVVENHEGEQASYDVATVLVPADGAGEPDPASIPVDEARLTIGEDEQARYEVGFTAPDEGTWKVQTTVQAEGGDELELHRWIAVTDQPSPGSSGRQTTPNMAR